MDSKENSSHVSLRVSETDPKFVGRGIALVDPKVMIELGLSTGDVVEISGNSRKTHVLLWSSQQQDFGRKLIRVDGYTRNNLGIGIDDNVSIRKVKTARAEQVVLSPAEELNVVGLEEHLPELLEGRVVTKGDMIPVNMVGRKIAEDKAQSFELIP